MRNNRTVSARLHRSFNISDTLDSHAVLIVAIDELIFQLANLINQHPELIRNIRNIFVARFTPNGELLLLTH